MEPRNLFSSLLRLSQGGLEGIYTYIVIVRGFETHMGSG
jgi:hypothetical protein